MATLDPGQIDTEKLMTTVTRKIDEVYGRAAWEIKEKTESYLKAFEEKDIIWKKRLANGEITEDEYKSWRIGQVMIGERWNEMQKTISQDLINTDEIAASIVNGYTPEAYALNHNYGTYEVEKGALVDTSYTLYDRETVERLIRENPDLLPEPSVDIPKADRWNKNKINSAILQGILQGESIDKIADRLSAVATMNQNAAMRNARTAMTGAQNAGRIDSYKRAEAMGIKMKQAWMATLDSRTRDTHAVLDGEQVDPGKKFSNGCRFPGDPNGRPEEIYNCRCRVVAVVEGSDPFAQDLEGRANKLEGISYEEWKEMHRQNIERRNARRQNQQQTDSDEFDRNNITLSPAGERMRTFFENRQVEYNQVSLLKQHLSEDEIIARLGGGDMTNGSCVSLAYAYAGNTHGLDVLDFRGGESRYVMAISERNLVQLLKAGSATIVEQGSTIRPAKKLLGKVEVGKEYILSTGRHAAIVRKTEDGKLQYLELQSEALCGWRDFEYERTTKWGTYERTLSDTLRDRFGCDRISAGISYLTDISCFENDDELRELLGYINTPKEKQQKGISGHVR